MKRMFVLLFAVLLAAACRPTGIAASAPAETAEFTAQPAEPTQTPVAATVELGTEQTASPVSFAPTASPDPFADRFSDTPLREEWSYKSRSVSVTITHHTVDETYGRRVIFHVADIYVRDVTSIRTEAAQGDFNMRYTRLVKDIAKDAGALLAIGGDTYTHVKKSFVIRNGVLYRDTPIENTDICVLYRDGRMETKKWGTFTAQEIIDADPWQVWGFGPALLDENGRSMEIKHRLMGHNPRAAIGYYEPGHYCFVIVDGRGESVGVTLNSLSRLMEDLGCKAAYNLDGGASAQMYWDGEIVSDPCGKGRVISDIIYLLPEE